MKKIVIIKKKFIIEKNCYNWKKIVIIEKNCDNWKFSSNINDVIKAVLNFLSFFYEKILHAQKSTKKHQKAPKAPKSTKTQPSKNTKTQISKQK